MVIVDTSVWSAFLRRDLAKDCSVVTLFRELVQKNQAQLLGIVKQEVLSGIKHKHQFKKIADILEGFSPLLATSEDHTLAAGFFNTCRAHGIQGSHMDFLICAQAVNNNSAILTTDKDFSYYKKVIPIDLLNPDL